MTNMWNLTNILLGYIACYGCMDVIISYRKEKKLSRMISFLEAINTNIDTLIIITRKEREKK